MRIGTVKQDTGFGSRIRAALHAAPLEYADDRARFGCHEIAGVAPEPGFLETARPAAVLVPIVARAQGFSVILTERAAHLSTHAGQVAFPGGRIDPGESAAEAALREAEEEIGLSHADVEPVGFLPPYFAGSGFRVQPLVALVSPAARLKLSPGEVARVFEVPLTHMLDPARYRTSTIFWKGSERRFFILDHEDAYIWGVTAGIMRSFAERFGG